MQANPVNLGHGSLCFLLVSIVAIEKNLREGFNYFRTLVNRFTFLMANENYDCVAV